MMKRIFWAFILLVLLCGCTSNNTPEIKQVEEEKESESTFYYQESDVWQDNSLDVYSAKFVTSLGFTDMEDALAGGAEQYILGKEKAMVFKKHLFQDVNACWDELKFYDQDKNEESHRLEFEKDQLNQAWVVGSVFDSDHCIMLNVEIGEDAKLLYKFFEVDDNLQILKTYYVNGLDENEYEFPDQILVDTEGNIHMITQKQKETWNYYVYSVSDDLLKKIKQKASLEQKVNLFYLSDGRVGEVVDGKLYLTDIDSGEVDLLAEMNNECFRCVYMDDGSILYVDGKGVHSCDKSSGNDVILYTWENHGISCYNVVDLQLSKEKVINILYASQSTVDYLQLVPTTEDVPVKTIEFAVSSSAFNKYQENVKEFNKEYPSLHIEMKKYGLNDSKLMTELIAGQGPQLLDSFLVGFEENAKYWEPMNDFYEKNNLRDVLIPQTMESGEIKGIPYGVVTDFSVNTMISFTEPPKEWDFESFLKSFSENGTIRKSVYNARNGSDGYSFATLFYHDLNQKFLYDAETGATKFDGQEFHEIMELAQHFMEHKNQADIDSFRQGEAPYAVVNIRQVGDLACLRVWGEEQLRYIGYPSEDGAVHLIEGSDPLCVRANSSDEEKKVAFTFLKFLMSYDVQKSRNNAYTQWSARKEVLEEQFENVDDNSISSLIGFPQISLEEYGSFNEDYATLCELLSDAKPKRALPRELQNILVEEVSAYLDGNLSEEVMTAHLTDRVELYLKEQKK